MPSHVFFSDYRFFLVVLICSCSCEETSLTLCPYYKYQNSDISSVQILLDSPTERERKRSKSLSERRRWRQDVGDALKYDAFLFSVFMFYLFVICKDSDFCYLFDEKQKFWPSIVMNKWLNIKPKVYDFSEDEVDTETESEDDG